MKKFKNNILILFAHPALQKSRVNKRLIEYVRGIDGVTFHDLYEAYPDFHIHVKYEQDLLMKNDVIVFHHPLFWFSVPALLKEWMDLVLEHGWAYGSKGKSLTGKRLLSVITTGGREAVYRKDGYTRHVIAELLNPIEVSARVCGMEYLPPFVVHGTHGITEQDIAAHGEDYRKIITALRDGMVNLESVHALPRLNSDMSSVIRKQEK